MRAHCGWSCHNRQDKLKRGIKKRIEMYRIVRAKNLLLQGKTPTAAAR